MLKNGSQSEFRRYAHRVNFVFAIRDWLYHVSVMTPRYHLLVAELAVVQSVQFAPDPCMRAAARDRMAERELAIEILAKRCGSGVAEGLPLAAEARVPVGADQFPVAGHVSAPAGAVVEVPHE